MTERKFFRVTTQGKEQLKSLNLNDVEMDTVLLALHGSLGSEIKKRGKITKGVLCETMMKIITLCDAFVEQIPCSGSASPAQIEQAQKETEDKYRKDLEEVKLTVAGGAKNDSQEDAVTGGSQETICRFYKVGRCKFSKKKETTGKRSAPGVIHRLVEPLMTKARTDANQSLVPRENITGKSVQNSLRVSAKGRREIVTGIIPHCSAKKSRHSRRKRRKRRRSWK